MTKDELILRRITGHHLLMPSETQTVVQDLCGVQAQFLGHALQGLAFRCHEVHTDGLIKTWSIRGTMHLFSVQDLPIFLHEGRSHFLRPIDTLETDRYINAKRKAYFADLIVEAIHNGIDERQAIKEACQNAGMTNLESKSIFDPWGGTIRALCEAGRICHKVQEKKSYQICPPFEPMDEHAAGLELTRRYFTHFGPATVKDAATFFGLTQAKIKTWMQQLPISEAVYDGKVYYFINEKIPERNIPDCLFLAGFDQLMLGYEKTESLMVPLEHMRQIYTLSGIIRPVILVNGEVVGWWNFKNSKLQITLFCPADKQIITETAAKLWPTLSQIVYL